MPDRLRPGARRGAILAALSLFTLSVPLGAQGGDQGRAAIAEGRAALERQDGVAAEVALRNALQGGAAKQAVAASLGQAYLLQKNYPAAREWLAPGDFLPAERMHGFHMLAMLEMAENNLPEAGAAFDKALEGNAGTAEIWVDVGRLRYRGGEHHQAFSAVEEALRLDPKHPRALEFRGQFARDAEGLLAALPWFEKGLKTAPEDIGLLGEYAATLGELGRAKDMLRITRKMIELDGGNPRAFYLQAVLAARAGNTLLARRLLWRANDAFKDVPAAMLLQGVLEMQAGNHALAAEAFIKLERMQPENPRVRMLLARALLENGEAREIIARLKPFADREDASPYLLTLMGRSFETLGDRAAAAQYLDRAAQQPVSRVTALNVSEAGELAIFRWGGDVFRLDATVPEVRKLLAQARYDEAMGKVMQVAARYNGSVEVQVLSGDVALARGDFERALSDYRFAAKVRAPLSLIQRKATALQLQGNQAEARRVVSDYLRQHPQSAEGAEMLGRMMAVNGDTQRALKLMTFARALRGNDGRDPWLLSAIALGELDAGEGKQALAHAQEAYLMQRANMGSAAVLARALQQAGRQAEAQALLAKTGG